jgi:single-strand DNA-binding protein
MDGMQDLNSVHLIGNLTRDAELVTGGEGEDVWKVARVGIAVQGRGDDEVHFFDLNAWGHSADYFIRNAQKGRRVAVEGRLSYRRWMSEDDQARSKVEIVVEEMWFLGPRKDGSEPAAAA